jgi:hypothetical protein
MRKGYKLRKIFLPFKMDSPLFKIIYFPFDSFFFSESPNRKNFIADHRFSLKKDILYSEIHHFDSSYEIFYVQVLYRKLEPNNRYTKSMLVPALSTAKVSEATQRNRRIDFSKV